MEKYNFSDFLYLYKNYFSQFKYTNPFTAIFCIPSFCFFIVLECLLFSEKIFISFFEFLPSNNTDEHVAYRIAIIFVFSFLYIFKYIVMGFFNAIIFVGGFLYDTINAIMTLGKGPSAFINW